VQVHPTGFVDPKDPDHGVKTLCAELLRGVGGVLLDARGRRFADELDTRERLTRAMTEAAAKGRGLDAAGGMGFAIVLGEAAAREADKHVPLYVKKGLLRRVEGAAGLAAWLRAQTKAGTAAPRASAASVRAELAAYDAAAARGEDGFGKTVFNNAPLLGSLPNPGSEGSEGSSPESSPGFYVGTVTPVLHYCMGGLRVDPTSAAVIDEAGRVVEGLFAAGELVGGIHGRNRLGGNALTECVVFGAVAAEAVVAQVEARRAAGSEGAWDPRFAGPSRGSGGAGDEDRGAALEAEIPNPAARGTRAVPAAELAAHGSEEAGCWVSLYGKVYDFSDFLEEHPAGPEAILRLCGKEGTDRYSDVHTEALLEDFEPVGVSEG
jgi:hypothetical protein